MSKKTIRSILVIDDDPDDFDLVSAIVQGIDPDIEVSFAGTCEDAMQYKGRAFDLILLDINMPAHDGFYWLRSIREHGHTDLPIVMYTNSRSPVQIKKAYEEGANLFFPKPESFDHMISSFKKLVQLDWSDPFSITRSYHRGEKYETFAA